MKKKLPIGAILLWLPFFLFLTLNISYASPPATEYLCELGVTLYNLGKYEDALSEFNKALLADPDNKKAKGYVDKIFRHSILEDSRINPLVLAEESNPSLSLEAVNTVSTPKFTKEQAMNQEMDKLRQSKSGAAYLYGYPDLIPKEEKVDRGLKVGPLKITGETQLSFGITPRDFIWKRANFDLNEKFKSWRPMSYDGFNRGFNTYDPRIYDSLSVNVDTENKDGFNFHTNVTVDPWSFTGKSNKITVNNGADSAELQLYYWSNTGYTVNHNDYSASGATIKLPELKVEDGKTSPVTISGFNIPAMKIQREFQPLRELWLDYTNDQIKFRAFPFGYQDQAYSSDDPMGITNRHIWWERVNILLH
ncbi:MAG: tetratricopeptide repeat protein [Candidatus Omnitrophica bacterium]|nr:tetratricopeptide repeat protein [Candidatus Omnitrophota bacterium]